ncbi:MAG: 4-oxalomesaconate tautomerase, partial [Beijerinckiaceae bacterium]|nr:4-oxalomesaconate tautomerase [Beijerinckiaceae bacterium]
RTTVRIYNVNTDSLITSVVETPGGEVNYEGNIKIDGVPGSAAPVQVAFLDASGAKTGKLLPTGNAYDTIDGVDMSLVDCAMPMMMMRAADMGKTGYETVQELEADKAFMARMEALRLKAGVAMGFGDVSKSVIPKPVLLAKPQHDAAIICVRYFMPHDCHPSLAVTGTIGIGTACVTPGTLAAEIAGPVAMPQTVLIENPAGHIEVHLSLPEGQENPMASLVRTARKLFEGFVYAKAAPGNATHNKAA